MAILTKTQLSASNATSFPDNTTGFITPALLRNYNTSSIDSYASLSGSNTFVGNQVITGSVIATSFTGSLQGTASWANNALTASFANSSNSSSLLITASVSNDIIDFTKGNNSTFSITVNNVKNSSTASVISVGGDNTNASRKIVFVGTTVASVNEQLLIAANTPDLSYNPTTNVINATASYASVAASANAINNSTINGTVTYGGLGGFMDNLVAKTTGSFNLISGSFTKILSVSSSTAMAINMNTYFAVVGGSPDEIGYQQYAGYLRPGSLSNIVSMPLGNASSQTLINPTFSASFNSGNGYIDVYGANSYGGITSSVIIDMTLASANPITIA